MGLERDFGKQFAAGERKQAAEQIRAIRKKLKTDPSQWDQQEINEADNPEIQEKLRELKKDFLGRLFETKKFLEKKEALRILIRSERQQVSAAILQEYNQKLDAILEKTPLTADEQERYLSEAAVISMNLKDYLTMMKRLSGYFLSHVTRYGVRQQTFMSTGGGHNVGVGEFMDNFTPALEAGKLNSFFTNLINETEYVNGILQKLVIIKIKEAKDGSTDKRAVVEEVLKELIRWDAHDLHPADRTTVHFASNDIAARYYGAEVGYNIYFYYPAEVIAKNYHHEWQGNTNVTAETDSWYNDVGVWNNGKGVPINAGLLCIPENIKVDRKTGSQYLLDANGKPVINPATAEHLKFYEANRALFDKVLLSLEKIRDKYENGVRGWDQFLDSDEVKEAAKILGFSKLNTFQSYLNFASPFNPKLKRFYHFRDRSYYARPPEENLISSKNFWESYFQKHPDQKPNKIFYFSSSFKGTKNREIIKSGAYNPLYEVKKFRNPKGLPNYGQFLEAEKQKMRAVVEKVYDSVSNNGSLQG